MYTYRRAIAIRFGVNERWRDVDISSQLTSTLFTTYREIYVVLNHNAVQEELTLNLDDVAADMQLYGGTISDYLSSIGNKSLPTKIGVPTIKRNNAVFSDAFASGFIVDAIDYMRADNENIPAADKPHLVVKPANPVDREDYDYLLLRQKVLANVNGFYHRTAADSKGYYILDGNKSLLKSGRNQVGLYSFGTFTPLEIRDIEDDMLSLEIDPLTNMVAKVHIRFTDCNLCEKTPILFLGGYMVMIDQKYLFLTNTNILTLKVSQYPFLERYFESEPYLDFGQFNIPNPTTNDDWVQESMFLREDYIRNYLTMRQSFLVMVDAQRLITEFTYPQKQTVPHNFISYEEPKWPLVTGRGKHEVFWKQYEDGVWSLNCSDTYQRNYIYQTTSKADRNGVDRGLKMHMAGQYGSARFLKLMQEEIVIKVV